MYVCMYVFGYLLIFWVCFETFFVQNGNIDTNLIDSGIQLISNFENIKICFDEMAIFVNNLVIVSGY